MSRRNSLTLEELNLIEETELFMKEVNANPAVANAELPVDLYEKIMSRVHSRRSRRKRCSVRKCWTVIAAAVLVLALGVTCMGGGERILEVLHLDELGREQTQTNTNEGTIVVDRISEEEVYQQIKDEFGFYPVVMWYRPEGTNFLKAQISKDIQKVIINYGTEEEVKIACCIYTNYREHSHGNIMEEQVLESYTMDVKGYEILVNRYVEEKEQQQRWLVEFVHNNVRYEYRMMDMEQDEVEKIIEQLYFG